MIKFYTRINKIFENLPCKDFQIFLEGFIAKYCVQRPEFQSGKVAPIT
jgi:hypothetical protein